MKIVNYILKCDYNLAVFLAGSAKDKIVPGAAFLFLNKVSFTVISLCFILLPLLPFKLNAAVAATLGGLLVLIVIKGYQKKIEEVIIDQKISHDYNYLNNSTRNKMILLGVFFFIFSYLMMFWIGVHFCSGFAK